MLGSLLHSQRRFLLFCLAACLLLTPYCNQVSAEELLYQVPDKTIANLVDVPPTPTARLSRDHSKLLLLEQPSLPSIAEVSQPELRLAGMRINPKTNGASRERSNLAKIHLLDLKAKNAKPVEITGFPKDARIANASWSPDASKVACTVVDDSSITLWIIDLSTARASKLSDAKLNHCYYFDRPYHWVSDGSIVAKIIPPSRGTIAAADPVPHGPVVQENDGKKRPARTDPNLLKNPHDEALLDYYMQSQLVRFQLDGKMENIGAPANYGEIAPSPDGKHLLVQIVHRPYSYKVSVNRFPYRVEVWSISGALEKLIADNPLAEEVPIDFAAVPVGPREFEWRSDADATVVWVEARDGGDPKVKAEIRDEVLTWAYPFEGKAKPLIQLALRYSNAHWGTGKVALVTEWWWADRKTRTFLVAPDDAAAKPRVVWDRSSEDKYSDPGNPNMDLTARGTSVLHQTSKGELALFGDGASPEGDRPFIDTLDLKTLKSKRLWRSEGQSYEFVADMVDDDGDVILTRRESVSEAPQYYLRTIKGNKLQCLTNFPNPNPSLAKVSKKLLQYERNDGVKLSGMLYMPPGFKPGESKPVPVLMWADPTEFKSKNAAGQVDDSPYRFVRAHYMGPLFALLMGYAVLDDPKFPIVGEGKEEPNDTYEKQLVAGAEAAVNEVVKIGVGDRNRMAIGGHSYGAFTTANLLAHSNLFRTGIARSGAYNRTLTPFGFQSEERDFWKAKNIYIEMSPFTYADKIDEPLLLIHGEADDNSGTYPIQSERLFEAMKGLGGKVRYITLPAEAHGYRARESVLHMLWEMSRWLDSKVTQ